MNYINNKNMNKLPKELIDRLQEVYTKEELVIINK
jgi:hypothetical protein